MEMKLDELKEIKNVLSSVKKVNILRIIEEGIKGYTHIRLLMLRSDVVLFPSEFYKHIRVLKKYGYIRREQNSKDMEITKKGRTMVRLIEKIMENNLRLFE